MRPALLALIPLLWAPTAFAQGSLTPGFQTTVVPKTIQTIPYVFPPGIVTPDPNIMRPINPVYKPNQQEEEAAKPTPAVTIIDGELGGRINEHWQRFQRMVPTGTMIEIRGACESACTVIMGAIPRYRICFGPLGRLSFHQARDENNQPVTASTQWMVNRYPSDVQSWIAEKGGVARMPLRGYWHLRAPDLWGMGYRRCDD